MDLWSHSFATCQRSFAEADLVIGRSGAGGVNEIAAAGMPSILVPFPFAADDHQLKNAEMLAQAGAARLVLDRDWNGERLVNEVEMLRRNPSELARMRRACACVRASRMRRNEPHKYWLKQQRERKVRTDAKTECLRIDTPAESRNNTV